MFSKFNLSALSLALLAMVASPVALAKHHKHTESTATVKSEPATSNTSNSYYYPNPQLPWDPVKPIFPTNYSQFQVWVQDLNGGKSNEPLFSCWRDMLCVSGLLDLDAVYYNRRGNAFGPTGSTGGPGVRPMFGSNISQVNGSINNANVFVDLKFPELVRIHSNLAYVNGGLKEDTYAWHPNADYGDVYRPGSSLRVDELYAVFSNTWMNPLYVKIGRMYLDFGQYIPNGYGLPTITPSLTQLMTQVRTGGAQLGFGLENGLYGSATWSMAQPSMYYGGFIGAARNYSGKLGYARQYNDAYFNVNASYIWDVRDADYLNGTVWILNSYIVPAFADSAYGAFSMRRQHAFAVHGDGKIGQLGGGIEAAATTGQLNPSNPNSNLWTAGADISYDFPTLGHASSLDLAYQIARHASYINGTGTITTFPFTGTPVGPFSNQMPANRIQATYIVKLIKHVNLGLQWVRDKDFGAPAGTNTTSDFGIFRIDLEF